MRYIICFVVMMLVFGGTTFAFDDVEEKEMEYVLPLVEKGIICGKGDGLFHGEDSLTRAEAVALLVRAMDLQDMASPGPSPFSDIEGHWAEECIDIYWSLGLVDGKPGNVFDPDGRLTYRQWIKLLLDLEGYGKDAEELGGFPDGYMSLALDRKWSDGGYGSIERMTVAKMLSEHMSQPFEFRRAMIVRDDNDIRLNKYDWRWAFARWQIYDKAGKMILAARVEFDEGNKSEESIREAVSEKLRLDRLGTGEYAVNMDMLGDEGKVIDSCKSRIMVMARKLQAPENVPVLKMDVIRLSQGYGGECGHKGTYAIDLIGKDDGADAIYAPFDGTIRKIYSENGSQNFVWLESDEPQTLQSGDKGYVTVMTGHDNHIEDLYVGKHIKKGEAYYNEGNSGAARGNHIHLEAGFSRATEEGWIQNQYGRWEISNSIPPEDVFVLDDSTSLVLTKAAGEIEFKYIE